MALMQLIYLSDLAATSELVLASIVASAVRNNQKNDVTGMLLYADGNFLQVIEGEAEQVQATFQRISRDPRHRNVTVLLEEPLTQRQFAHWSMGYKQLSEQELRAFPQYAPFFKFGRHVDALRPSPGDALDMLQMFSKGAF